MEKTNMKKMAIVAMMGTGAFMGYKYVMSHPEVKAELKNKAKCATKKIYEKLDDMD